MSHQNQWLFTPGPLNTSANVKAAQLEDLGSRDRLFIDTVADIRRRLLALAGQQNGERYTGVLMQGSGTFGIESVISSTVKPEGKLLLVINGAYGRRMRQMTEIHGISHYILEYPENEPPDPVELEKFLAEDESISMVTVVHCETTTGILNPLVEIAKVVNRQGRQLMVDAMSSFGAVPVDVAALNITYLVSSANKCIEGVPGFSFIIAELDALKKTQGYAHSLSLDLYAQWAGLEKNGQFRFTPPIQSMLAFHKALVELEDEGGVDGRAARYQANHETLYSGMIEMGFQPYLDPAVQSYIITTFHYPDHANFQFDTFYSLLSERGFVIYPGKLTEADCFRLGNIGRMYPEQMRQLLSAIAQTLEMMGVEL